MSQKIFWSHEWMMLVLWHYTGCKEGYVGRVQERNAYGGCDFGSSAFVTAGCTFGAFLDLRDSVNISQIETRSVRTLTMAVCLWKVWPPCQLCP
jgi:hypothetical protein